MSRSDDCYLLHLFILRISHCCYTYHKNKSLLHRQHSSDHQRGQGKDERGKVFRVSRAGLGLLIQSAQEAPVVVHDLVDDVPHVGPHVGHPLGHPGL